LAAAAAVEQAMMHWEIPPVGRAAGAEAEGEEAAAEGAEEDWPRALRARARTTKGVEAIIFGYL
jgi:hypothetical protein